MAIKYRHRLSTQITMLGLAAAAIMSLTFVYVIPYVQTRLYDDKKSEIKHTVIYAAAALAHQVEEETLNDIGDRQILADARMWVVNMSKAGSEYFWLQDDKGIMLAHPYKPELVDNSQWDFQDPNGQYVFRNLAAKAKQGGGFVQYLWPKPGLHEPVAKISYVTKVDGTDWIIGSGLYVHDIKEHIGRMTFSMAAIAGVKLVVVLAACWLLGKSYTKPVTDVLRTARKIGRGDLTAEDIDDARKDELGSMARELNSMKSSLTDDVRIVTAAAHLTGFAASEIEEGNRNMAERVQDRAAASEQLSAAVIQMSGHVAESAELTGRANEQAARLAEDLKDLDLDGLDGPAGEKLTGMADRIWQLATGLSDAAAMAWEQSVAVKEMEEAIGRLDKGIQQDVQLVEQLASAAENLDDEAKSLIEQMKRFKLS